MVLSTSVDSTYADDGSDASVKIHQQDHDTIHTAVNALAGGTTGQVLAKTSSADYAQAWTTPGFGGGDYFRSGYYAYGHEVVGSFGTRSMTAGYLIARPFWVPVRRAFDRIAVNITTAATAASGGVVRMGIYNPGAGLPGSLLVDAGTISTESTGAKEITISQTLDPGIWWLVTVGQVATSTATAFDVAQTSHFVSLATTAPPTYTGQLGWSKTGVTGALPSTLTGLGEEAGSRVPLCTLRAA